MTAAAPSGVVTFLFTDVEGSTRRWEADADGMRLALAAHDVVLRAAIEGHDGFLFSHTGDGVVAAFASPRCAVDAAVAAQRALELPVRMGISTGEAELRDGDYFGAVLNRAARVMAAGHGGQILLAESTAVLLTGVDLLDLGPRRLRDLPTNQKRIGLLPNDVELSPINPHGEPDVTGPGGQPWPQLDFVRPWDSLNDDERRLFVRMAEVYAGFVSYTDDQIGRFIDYLAESEQLDNTIIVVVSDNGASGEGGPNGSFNENKFFNNVPDTIEANLARLDDLGSPTAYNHYNTGWAWAFDTPFPYWKRFAGYEGGVADPLIISWPAGITARGDIRDQYVHAVDIVPTLYQLLGVEPPDVLNGWTQNPIEGRSFAPSFTDTRAPGRDTQFYSMLGMRALYHQGWLATTLHPPISGWSHFDEDVWELYDLRTDRTQLHNLAAEKPALLEELKGLWFYNAGVYKGLPLDDRTAMEIMTSPRPEPGEPRGRYIYYPDTADVPESVAVNIRGRSYTIAAAIGIDTPEAEGALFAHGGVAGGHSLYVKEGRLHYVYNWLGERIQTVSSPDPIPTGTHVLTAEFQKTRDDPDTHSAVGKLTLYVDTEAVADAEIMTQPGTFSLTGDGLCVGRDSGSAVGDYTAPFPFVGGTIERVIVDVSGDHYVDHEKAVLAYIARD